MTPMMRWNLLRYGVILFLDMKKNQYNVFNWPYCGIVIKYHKMMIGLVCEFLGIGEDLDAYAWIIRMLAVMEPRWCLPSIKIIFGDQLITDGLLNRLDIKHTCLLRGDYYHLMREVWPRKENFGLVVYEQIKPWLKQILLSPDEDVWDRSYDSICRVIENDPKKMALLDKIYDNPSYYGGFYLKAIQGNLKLNGAVPAEQNHSSVAAHLGKGNKWSLTEEVKELMVRQQEHFKAKKTKADALYVASFKFKSKCSGQQGIDEVIAKRNLSTFAFKELFQKSYMKSQFLQSCVENDGSMSIWKAGGDRDTCKVVVVHDKQPCECLDHKSWSHQCEHDLLMDGGFMLSKWDNRWLNNHSYQDEFPSMLPNIEISGINDDSAEFVSYDVENESSSRTMAGNKLTSNESNPFDNDPECPIDEFSNDFPCDVNDAAQKISYQELII